MPLSRDLFLFSVWPYLHLQPRFNTLDGECRIEVRGLPLGLAREAQRFTIHCVACGALIHPFRVRKGAGNKRAKKKEGPTMFLACSCPQSVNPSCSRTTEAAEEYHRIVTMLRGTYA